MLNLSALGDLHSQGHLELLDVVDRLRGLGLSEFLPLPQLVVCGDQSSGKSSLLEAISGVPFPKKDNLCTRFATEVILRRNDASTEIQAAVSITPGTSRSEDDRNNLTNFKYDLLSLTDLPEMVQRAKEAMGLGSLGSAFSADVLRLEVTGPRIPQLTIVDLPGLIHSENKLQTAQDVELVTTLVENYMLQERSIVLAVVSAKNDYANQIILKKARRVDPEGNRTMGIITKPDTLHPGSDSEAAFLSLAKNQDIKFKLGWHVVRNADSNTNSDALGSRNEQEESFFEKSNWKLLVSSFRGIDTLRERLSVVLFEQIKRELPTLVDEIQTGISACADDLDKLGNSRNTEEEQRMYLSELGQKFYDLCRAGCDGNYEDEFFTASARRQREPTRIRALVQNESKSFAQRMARKGSAGPMPVDDEDDKDGNDGAARRQAVDRTLHLLRIGRGRELPGTYNPMLIGELFREYSVDWESITHKHLRWIWQQAKHFVELVLHKIADDHVVDMCCRLVTDPELEDILKFAVERLGSFLTELKRQPITYNHYFVDTVRKIRRARIEREICTKLERAIEKNGGTIHTEDARWAVLGMLSESRLDMDAVAAEEVVDHTFAYYKVRLTNIHRVLSANVSRSL